MPWWFFCSEENWSDFHGGEGGGALTLFYCMGFGMWVWLLLLPLQLWQSSALWSGESEIQIRLECCPGFSFELCFK